MLNDRSGLQIRTMPIGFSGGRLQLMTCSEFCGPPLPTSFCVCRFFIRVPSMVVLSNAKSEATFIGELAAPFRLHTSVHKFIGIVCLGSAAIT